MLFPRHGRRVHGYTFRRVIAGDRADRAINHPIWPLTVSGMVKRGRYQANVNPMEQRSWMSPNAQPESSTSASRAGLPRPQPQDRGWAPLAPSPLDTPPFGLQHMQVVFSLQIQRNSSHSILSLCRGDPHGYGTPCIRCPPCVPGTPVWSRVQRKAGGRVAWYAHPSTPSGLERRPLTAGSARPCRSG